MSTGFGFGGPPSSGGSGVFGQASNSNPSSSTPTTTAPTNLFGTPVTSQQSSSFGGTTSQPASTGSIFGSLSATAGGQKPLSFGFTPTSNQTSGSSTPTLFGGSTGNNGSNQPGGLFGGGGNATGGSSAFGSFNFTKMPEKLGDPINKAESPQMQNPNPFGVTGTTLGGGGGGSTTGGPSAFASFNFTKKPEVLGDATTSKAESPKLQNPNPFGSTGMTVQQPSFGSLATSSAPAGSTTPAATKTGSIFNFANSTTPAGPPPALPVGNSTGTGAGLFGGQKPAGSTSQPATSQALNVFGSSITGGSGSNVFAPKPATPTSGTNIFSGLTAPKPATLEIKAPTTASNATSATSTSKLGTATSVKPMNLFGTTTTSAQANPTTAAPSLFNTPATTAPAVPSLFNTPATTAPAAPSLFNSPATTAPASSIPAASTPPLPLTMSGGLSAPTTSSGSAPGQTPSLFSNFGKPSTAATPAATPAATTASDTTISAPAPTTSSSGSAPGLTPSLFSNFGKTSTATTPAATTAATTASDTTTSAPAPALTATVPKAAEATNAFKSTTAAGTSGGGPHVTFALGASMSGPAPQLSRLKNKTMDEIITRWATDLSTYQKEFQDQAAKAAAWDRLLVENGEKIQKLYSSTFEAERASAEVERQLASVESQQDELTAWLDHYEREVDQMFAKQVGSGESLQGPDQERERTYRLAEKLGDRLDEMGRDLTNMIQEINNASAALTTTSKPEDPLSQIVRVLNGHLNQLQWIDKNATLLREKVEKARNGGQSLATNGNEGENDVVDEFYRSYMGRR